MATKKSGTGNGAVMNDPVLAELLKRRAETLESIDSKIRERRKTLSGKSRKAENRLKILIGVAYLADAELHPEKRAEITATLNRAITDDKNRAFLKSLGWL